MFRRSGNSKRIGEILDRVCTVYEEAQPHTPSVAIGFEHEGVSLSFSPFARVSLRPPFSHTRSRSPSRSRALPLSRSVCMHLGKRIGEILDRVCTVYEEAQPHTSSVALGFEHEGVCVCVCV